MIGKFSSHFSNNASGSSSSKSSGKPQPEGSSSAGAVSGMKPKEVPLAGYLMARAAMHRKVEGQDLKNLRAGNESVQQGSDLLHLGRSNVIQDVEKAKAAHLPVRFTVSTKMGNFLFNYLGYSTYRAAPKNIRNRVMAAAGQYAETGVCHSFAASIAPLHAAKLPGMKDERAIVALCNVPPRDHVWPEMILQGKGADGKPILHGKDVIMDAWCKENLAILRKDSDYARQDENGKGDHLKHHDLLNHKTGPKALKEVENLKARINSKPHWRRECDDDFNDIVKMKLDPGAEKRRNAESVFHADFREQAGKALHKDARELSPVKGARNPDADPVAEQVKHDSLARIQAVGVARSLGSNIRGAKAETSEIIASAKGMFPGPESIF